jgi:hypothetical protein
MFWYGFGAGVLAAVLALVIQHIIDAGFEAKRYLRNRR